MSIDLFVIQYAAVFYLKLSYQLGYHILEIVPFAPLQSALEELCPAPDGLVLK